MPTVIVDTSEWAQYFRVARSPEALEVRRLLIAGDVVMVGVIYAELLRGARDERHLRTLEEELDALPFLETSKETWLRTGKLLAELRSLGVGLALPDAVIATQALEHGLRVFSRDQDFGRVPELELHSIQEPRPKQLPDSV